MLTNCFRFAPRDSVPGLIAKICKYLKDHPGWSDEELEEQIKQFIGQTGVESFNGRTGAVELNEDDVNNLKIASAYFAEGDETIDELDLVTLYNQGVRFVFTNWNSVTSGYDLAFVLDYFSGSNGVVFYPMATGSGGGGNIISVNGKTGIVELSLSDILGDSGAQVKLCTAMEFTSNTLVTWNEYYEDGYRIVGVVNSDSTAIDYLYLLKQDENNHQPIGLSTGASGAYTPTNPPPYPVTKVNGDTGEVFTLRVDPSDPGIPTDTPAPINATTLNGKGAEYYATARSVNQLSEQKADKTGWDADKFLGTDANGNMVVKDAPESGADPLTIYPVGSIYLSTNSTSPASLFGGTWEQLKDRFLLGAGGSYTANNTGGSASHAHSLSDNGVAKLSTSGNKLQMHSVAVSPPYPVDWEFVFPKNGQNATDPTQGYGMGLGGNTDMADALPPYLAVYMWKRVS